ncbi:hypothetical protein ACFWUP_27060 [Nocardia sp. NPDC058658]
MSIPLCRRIDALLIAFGDRVLRAVGFGPRLGLTDHATRLCDEPGGCATS